MKLSKFINRFIFSIAFFSISIAFFLSIIFQYINFEKDKVHIQNEFIELKKNELKKEIQIVFNLIDNKEEVINRLTGELKDTSIEEIRKDTQNKILDWLATYRFGENGYIFVNNLNKQALIWDGKRVKTPMPYPLESLYQSQLDTSKKEEGDFLFYKFKKTDSVKEFEKLSFIRKYDKYDWIIGAGIYSDEIKNQIIRKKEIFNRSIGNQIKSLLFLYIFMYIAIYIISRRISKYINMNINNLTSAFEKAAKENEKIDTNNLTYKEFISLANNLNITLESKNDIEKKLQDYINIVNENIIISTTDKEGKILDASKAFCDVSGFSKEELIGKTHSIIRHPDTTDSFYKNIWDVLSRGEEWKGEIKNKNKSGKDYWVLAVIKPVFKNNHIIGFTALRTNITNRKFIEHLSITDELTQLYNRRFFNTKIEEEINRAKRENNSFSLLIMDIDYFKEYNDTYGHQEGDLALAKVAGVLRNYTNRSSDFAFRLGGEEFGIITLLDKEKVIKFAILIKNEIEKLKIEHEQSVVSKYLTISIGITSKEYYNISNSTILYKEADDALYKAKNNGRNCIFVQE